MSTPAITPRSRHRTARSVVAACAGVAVASAMMSVSAPMESSAATGPDVRINEYASGGPGGADDAFVEITNVGDADADIDGYRIVHCDRAGNRGQEPMVPDLQGVVLAPGETYLLAHEDSTVTEEADELFDRALYAEASGIWVEDAELNLIDRLSVSPQARSSFCGTSIPSDLDYVSGQSWQRVDITGDPQADFIRAARTPNEPNTTTPDPGVQASDVLVTEIANGGSEPDSDVVELANFGQDDADLSGWSVYACTEFGYRTQETLLATFDEGTALEPGEALVLGNSGVEVPDRSEEHTSELQSRGHLVCRLLLEKKNKEEVLLQEFAKAQMDRSILDVIHEKLQQHNENRATQAVKPGARLRKKQLVTRRVEVACT